MIICNFIGADGGLHLDLKNQQDIGVYKKFSEFDPREGCIKTKLPKEIKKIMREYERGYDD